MSDLGIVCVLGKGLVRGSFPISKYVVCVQSCDGSRGGPLNLTVSERR